MIRAALGPIALLWATGAAGCETDGIAMQSSAPDAPEMWIAMPEIPVAQPFALTVQYCGDAPVSIEVSAMMPAHQHGMNYQPTVEDMGGGVFVVDPIVLHMPGTWELQVEVQGPESGQMRYTHLIAVK